MVSLKSVNDTYEIDSGLDQSICWVLLGGAIDERTTI
jgi:hypothetical protein